MAINSDFLRNNRITRPVLCFLLRNRARVTARKIRRYIRREDRILDFGSGTCNIWELLQIEGYNITGVDIKNVSLVPSLSPVIYDGRKLPFDDNAFDVALVISVLHHTPNPEELLGEIKRVSHRILLIEDVYQNTAHKYITYLTDSFLNQEFSGHPHSNKTDREWRTLFSKLSLRLKEYDNKWYFTMHHAMYYLEKNL